MTSEEFKTFLTENVEDDAEICVSVYACGATLAIPLEFSNVKVIEGKVVIDAEYN
jgi:hypothetical protein